MLRDQQHRLEVGERIRRLRLERVPRPKVRELADMLGYSDSRGYSKAEATGGISWEKIETLADFYGVDPFWILNGEDRPDTPDLALNGRRSELAAQLGRIEDTQQTILSRLDALATQIDAVAAATGAGDSEQTPGSAATSEAPPARTASR